MPRRFAAPPPVWPLLLAAVLLAVLSSAARAQAPGGAPVLRIEAGTHIGRTNDAAVDAAGRVLVTAGNDKTARMWSLPDLRPLGVLRPPIGPDSDYWAGMVYAVAVSPDGRLAAIGGPRDRGAGHQAVLLFDLRTRQVLRGVAAGLPAVVQALAFSPDGSRLAVGLSGTDGIRVFRASDAALLAEDRDYQDSVQGLSFAPDGRLAAAADDGAVRLYDVEGRRLQRVATEAGRRPWRVRFGPGGRLLALGFGDTVALEVRDGTTLALRARPDVAGLAGGILAQVAWSADGRTLYAGGVRRGPRIEGGQQPVLAWDAAGVGRRVAAAGFGAAPSSILPLQDRGLVFTSLSSDIAVVGRNGRRIAERRGGAGNLATAESDPANPSQRLRLSRDGSTVEWAFFDAPGRWLRFDAAGPAFAAGEPPAAGLADWSASAPGLAAADWAGRPDPKLNGRPLALEQHEWSYSAAVAHGRVLLGADWSLRLFDGQGRELWRRPVPGVAWRVNQSPDGRLAVAAYNDGTIRWHRASDGQELLALFVTPEPGPAPRWVAWTPSGYYAASAGGEELIGWHLNNGPDRAADFFPASRFRDTYHQPDVVTRVLSTLDEAEALHQADAARGQRAPVARVGAPQALRAALPPVAAILSPAEGDAVPATGEARLAVRLRSPSGQPIARVRVLVDGRLQPGAVVDPPRPLPAPGPGEAAEEREVRVDLSAAAGREAVVQVVAATEAREGEPAMVRLRVAAPPAAAAAPPARLPRLNAVLVGVSAYREPRLRLDFAAKDAADFAALLKRQEGRLYREVSLRVLPDAQASRAAVNDALVWLNRETTDRDTAVLFLAGHGVATHDGDFYFLPADSDGQDPEVTGIPGDDIKRPLRRMAGRVLVFLDTCYAGALFSTERTRGPPNMNEVVNELLAARRGLAVYSATTENTRAQERRELGNGVFTAALLRGLAGAADQHPADGVVRVAELADFLAEEVKRLTGGRQKATFGLPRDGVATDPLFVLAR